MSGKGDIVVSVDKVSKNFVLPHEKVTSVKKAFIQPFRRNRTVETQHALKHISFEIKKGEFFGIVGRNGSGKSTLLKILAGIYQPTAGKVRTHGKLVPFIELGVGFNPELTGRENVYLNGAMLGFSRKEIDAQYDKIVEFAELERFMDQKLKNYSSGMQVRLAFSVATTAQADILLIDEVLAVGDADFQRKCFDYFQKLKGSDTTVIFVTHDMNAVREYCDRAVLIEKSEIVASGTSADVASKYTRMFMEEAKVDGDKEGEGERRWGDGVVTFTKVSVPKKVTADSDLSFSFVAKAQKDTKGLTFGFLIKNAAGAHILGTNTRIKQLPTTDLKEGEEVEIRWSVPNIFNDGVHYIDPAIVYRGDVQVADWWEEAGSFMSAREERTPYLVNPPIKCSIDAKE